jgi:hypothetical protein
MTRQQASPSHSLIGIAVILAVPVLYVLSIGPVSYLEATKAYTISQGSRLDRFYGPLGTAMQRTPLDEVLLSYVAWWTELGEKRQSVFRRSNRETPRV